MPTPFPTIALIVAAGTGVRLGSEIPKAYVKLRGQSLLRRTLEIFLTHPEIDAVRVVISRPHHPLWRQETQGLTLMPCVIGGATRQESVRRGLESLRDRNPRLVLIHDAARPLVSHALISQVIAKLQETPAVFPALPMMDTLKKKCGEDKFETIDRAHLFAAQTPQGFVFSAIDAAHQQFRAEEVTDDIALAEKAGLEVSSVPGECRNVKLTTAEDIFLMNQLLATEREIRVGNGFDVHGFIPHDPAKPDGRRHVVLCGVNVPYPQKLKGNSDADVGLHALVDAILGAIGEGDIGMHFAAEDPKWSGADSSRFLIYAYQLLKQKGGEIVNLDITIIGESPHIAPHREAMQTRIADVLKIAPSRVNVKGCTTEKLGFLGRGEGLAAQATATVTLPALAA